MEHPSTTSFSVAPPQGLRCPVFIVGFMGAGKTSVARKMARLCHTSSLDLDRYLGQLNGGSPRELIAQYGEQGFRDMETDALYKAASLGNLCISCGGGIVERAENRAFLQDAGYVVHLYIEPREARARISDISTRPLFKSLPQAEELFRHRLPLYEEVSDICINASGKNVASLSYEIKDALIAAGVME